MLPCVTGVVRFPGARQARGFVVFLPVLMEDVLGGYVHAPATAPLLNLLQQSTWHNTCEGSKHTAWPTVIPLEDFSTEGRKEIARRQHFPLGSLEHKCSEMLGGKKPNHNRVGGEGRGCLQNQVSLGKCLSAVGPSWRAIRYIRLFKALKRAG